MQRSVVRQVDFCVSALGLVHACLPVLDNQQDKIDVEKTDEMLRLRHWTMASTMWILPSLTIEGKVK